MITLEDLVRDLDMIVYRLERPPAKRREELTIERALVRLELEQLRARLEDLVRSM